MCSGFDRIDRIEGFYHDSVIDGETGVTMGQNILLQVFNYPVVVEPVPIESPDDMDKGLVAF